MMEETAILNRDTTVGSYERHERTVVSGGATASSSNSTSTGSLAVKYRDAIVTRTRAGSKVRVAITIQNSMSTEKIVSTNRLVSGNKK